MPRQKIKRGLKSQGGGSVLNQTEPNLTPTIETRSNGWEQQKLSKSVREVHRSVSAHTFDTNLSVTSHISEEPPRHFDGSRGKMKNAFLPLPPLKFKQVLGRKILTNKSFDGTLGRGNDNLSMGSRREPSARLEQELDVFLSGDHRMLIAM